jgi:hypothetical protein
VSTEAGVLRGHGNFVYEAEAVASLKIIASDDLILSFLPMAHVFAREKKGLRPGGFGILMSQSLADELLYNEAQNEVVFVKYLDGTWPGSVQESPIDRPAFVELAKHLVLFSERQ